MKKWKTGGRRDNSIEAVEVLRETAAFVFLPADRYVREGAREAKVSDWHRYHDTWEQAHAYLLERSDAALTQARRALAHAQDVHGNVKGMKKPADE